MVKADKFVLERMFLMFKTLEEFGGYEEKWTDIFAKTAKDISMDKYPGATLAYVSEDKSLVIIENYPFVPFLNKFNPKEYLTVSEYSKLVGKSESVIKKMIKNGKIKGAYQKDKFCPWYIPKDTPYPKR